MQKPSESLPPVQAQPAQPGPVQPKPTRTWMPTTAGILTIVAGAIDIILGIMVAAVAEVFGIFGGFRGLGAIGVPMMVIGVVAIVGGIFAIRRRVWGLALAGAICALFPPHIGVLGVLSIIFVALSKKEFD